ncbi:MAG: carnitine 3-dehydrogenase [Planktomarina sp.]|nr:carnitine 3-dehydrogenase [Planktomarina sp.]
MTKIAAIIGGGVIGGGWAARFLLNGWDVRVFDPDPEAERKISEVLHNARRSLPGLYEAPLPDEGNLSFHSTMPDAVAGAIWIQESVPEQLALKQKVYQSLQAHCDLTAVLGSSTSGFKPSELQAGALRPEQIMVCHPFNPVYLLPLIEVVPTDKSDFVIVERAEGLLRDMGMYPLRLRKEIDAHIADRFLEAVWREALWLIKDGIASTEEIDNAIRYGFGIRWAQMGLFETYRVAGGEAGMRHFMAQFGPALKWPWTKLMDVPEFTDELVDMISDQSDAQSGMHSIRELERIRDNNLVGMMRALKAQDWGAGALLKSQDHLLNTRAAMSRSAESLDLTRLTETLRRAVPLDWTDYNGHMNEARYLQAFGDATDRFMEIVGCDADYIAAGSSYFTAETHIRHIDEVHAGHVISIYTYCVEGAGKKMHLFHQMFEGDRLLATGEHMLIHVSLETRKATLPTENVAETLALISLAHAALERPEGLGRMVGRK